MSVTVDKTNSLRAQMKHHEPIALQRRFSTVNVFLDDITPTLEAGAGQGGNNMPMILENHPADSRLTISKRQHRSDLIEQNGNWGGNTPMLMNSEPVVRRLTPLECERLQGYPDGWTDIGEWTDSKGKRHKEADSPRYKALGNSIALPFWQFLLNRIAAECKEKTMVSLFDGIGGFPLCWQRAGGETLWVSEIEDLCIAVTKKRFGEEETK